MENNVCQIIKLTNKLLTTDSNETKKTLLSLLENPDELLYFREEFCSKNLSLLLDSPHCQTITLQLLETCCEEIKFCLNVTQSNLLPKLVGLLYKTMDTSHKYVYVMKVLNVILRDESSYEAVIGTCGALEAILNILLEEKLNEEFFHEFFKTIRLMARGECRKKTMIQCQVVCKLSELLKRSFSFSFTQELLQLIVFFFHPKWNMPLIEDDKHSILLILMEIVESKEILSNRLYTLLINHLLPIINFSKPFASSDFYNFLIENFNETKSYQEKHKILNLILIYLYKCRGVFVTDQSWELFVVCLEDVLLKPSYITILTILAIIKSHASVNIDVPVSFCFKFIEECNFFDLSEMTSILLNETESGESVEKTEQKQDCLIVKNIFKQGNIDEERIGGRRNNLNDYLGRRFNKDKTSIEGRQLINLQARAVDFLLGIVWEPEVERHFNSPQRIQTLLNAIATSPCDLNIRELFSFLSDKQIFTEVLISQMVLPKMYLFNKMYPDAQCLIQLYAEVKRSLQQYVDFLNLQTNHLPPQTRLKFILSACYTFNVDIPECEIPAKRDLYFGDVKVMGEMVSCMYDDKHPLRLLVINSYCLIISTIEEFCDCEIEQFITKKDVEEKDYDVCFIVGKERFRSVKIKLMQHSEVFTAMFNGFYSESISDEVVVTDTTPEAFQIFNKTLLRGGFEFVEKNNCEVIMQVLQLADKYLVTKLEWQIARLITSNLSAYLGIIFEKNLFIGSGPLFICSLLKLSKKISLNSEITCLGPQTFQQFTNLIHLVSEDYLKDISHKLVTCQCLHKL